ncbi:MAG: hypothetical protein EB015_14455 [Methylocystaceae bacterium]|nr:hypothetical protein [Methylocystaceae bacterium]
MKTTREMDILLRHTAFDDTPAIVDWLADHGMSDESKHLAKMYTYQKHLVAEIKKLRRKEKK